MEQHESILISRLKEGDEWAYEVLFREYALLLTSYANSIVEDTDLAKVIVQSLFVSLWDNRQSCRSGIYFVILEVPNRLRYRRDSSFLSWVFEFPFLDSYIH